MKRSMRPALAVLAALVAAGCANCQACKSIPGWDGRYADHYRGPSGEGHPSLPITPYVPR